MNKFKSAFAIAAIIFLSGCSDNNKDNQLKEAKSLLSDTAYNLKEAKLLLSETVYNLKIVGGDDLKVKKIGSDLQFIGKEDKLILLDLFSTWCPACRNVAPHLSNLQQKFPKKLMVLGILLEENKPVDDVIDFQKKYGANYPISNSSDNFKLSTILATQLRLPRSFPIPLLVMLKNGKYFTHYVGAVPEEMIESDIKRALQ